MAIRIQPPKNNLLLILIPFLFICYCAACFFLCRYIDFLIHQSQNGSRFDRFDPLQHRDLDLLYGLLGWFIVPCSIALAILIVVVVVCIICLVIFGLILLFAYAIVMIYEAIVMIYDAFVKRSGKASPVQVVV